MLLASELRKVGCSERLAFADFLVFFGLRWIFWPFHQLQLYHHHFQPHRPRPQLLLGSSLMIQLNGLSWAWVWGVENGLDLPPLPLKTSSSSTPSPDRVQFSDDLVVLSSPWASLDGGAAIDFGSSQVGSGRPRFFCLAIVENYLSRIVHRKSSTESRPSRGINRESSIERHQPWVVHWETSFMSRPSRGINRESSIPVINREST